MKKRLLKVSVLAAGLLTSAMSPAQVLVEGAGKQVTADEIRKDVERVGDRAIEAMSKPEALANNVTNIYVRRVLAAEAKAGKLDQNPLVKLAIAQATERILSDAMLETIDQKNQPSLQAIEAYAQSAYKANPKKFEQAEQVRASHILIRTAEPEGKAKIEALYKELQGGADFAAVAKEQSQDPGSAAKGGDLGLFGRGRMIKPFEDAAFGLQKVGDMSGIVESPFGWHIIKLTERKPAGVRPFEEVKDQLMREAQNEILTQARFKEQDRILKNAKFNREAIEALAKTFAESAGK